MDEHWTLSNLVKNYYKNFRGSAFEEVFVKFDEVALEIIATSTPPPTPPGNLKVKSLA